VIKLKFLKKPRIEVELAFFFDLVKSLFSQRRKNLLNSLSRTLNLNKDKLKVILKDAGIDFKRRGETLNLEELGKLVKLISEGK
jgi:16S rRNA (adenine1518-N6/adenine1519-N6)-dimethyltransferase